MGLLGSKCTLQYQHFSSWAMVTCSSWKFLSALETGAEALSTDFPLLCHTSQTAIMNTIMANILTFDVFPLDLPSPATSLLKTWGMRSSTWQTQVLLVFKSHLSKEISQWLIIFNDGNLTLKYTSKYIQDIKSIFAWFLHMKIWIAIICKLVN